MIRPVLIAAVGHEVATKAEVVATAGAGVATVMALDWSMIIFGVPNTVLFASFLGSAVALSVLPKMTKTQMFSALFCGTVSGGYFTPWAATMADTKNFLSVGFLIGVIAHLVLTILFKNAAEWASGLYGAVKDKIGGK